MGMSWHEIEEKAGKPDDRRWDLEIPPCCPQCSYVLQGVKKRRCPECGSPFTWSELRIHGRDIRRLLTHAESRIWRAKIGAACVGVGLIVLAGVTIVAPAIGLQTLSSKLFVAGVIICNLLLAIGVVFTGIDARKLTRVPQVFLEDQGIKPSDVTFGALAWLGGLMLFVVSAGFLLLV